MFTNRDQIESWLSRTIDALNIKCQEFRAKCDNATKKKRKGSKVDNSRRSAEQVEENIRNLQKIKKILRRDQVWVSENVKQSFILDGILE